VRRGRQIYDNIVAFVRFQLGTTMGFGITFLVAAVFGVASGKPFTAIQVLWVNIIMDGPPAMALGVDKPGAGVMTRPPRPPGARILPPARLARLLLIGAAMAAGTLAILQWGPDS